MRHHSFREQYNSYILAKFTVFLKIRLLLLLLKKVGSAWLGESDIQKEEEDKESRRL